MKDFRKSFVSNGSLTKGRKEQLQAFCKSLALKFSDLELLDLAFHHRSYSNENTKYKRFNNERLEFLGDSVLGLSTAAYLYGKMAENPEGDLAKIKASVVSEKALAPVARSFGIDKMLVLGHGEELSGGRNKDAILADCVEAIIGACYLDKGFEEANRFVLSFIIPAVDSYLNDKGVKDYKTLLQEAFQKKVQKIPVYELLKKSGPDHDQIFYVQVKLGDKVFGPCEGKSKKEAEKAVAKLAYEEMFGK